MNDDYETLSAEDIAIVHDTNDRLLNRPSVDPSEAVLLAANALVERRVSVRGECRNCRTYAASIYFDIACTDPEGNISLIGARIVQRHYRKIARYLQSQHGTKIGNQVAEGHEVTVEGVLSLDLATGGLTLDARRLGPGYSRRGRLAVAGDETLAKLQQIGVPRARLSSNDVHHRPENGRTVPWPSVFRTIKLITTFKSQGAEDFMRQMSRTGVTVQRVNVPMRGTDAPDAFIEAMRETAAFEVSAIVVVRGGGRWPTLAMFDRFDIAESIYRSPVPVLTAIGHSEDITMADRCAAASFDTPTAAGSAIAKHLRMRVAGSSERRSSDRNVHTPRWVAEMERQAEGVRQAREKVGQLEADLAQAIADKDQWIVQWHEQAYRAGLTAVRLRSLAGAAIALAGVSTLVTGIDRGCLSGWWWSLVACLTVGGVHAFLGARRATSPVARGKCGPVLDWDTWCSTASKASTPRQFRRLWQGGQPVNRFDA